MTKIQMTDDEQQKIDQWLDPYRPGPLYPLGMAPHPLCDAYGFYTYRHPARLHDESVASNAERGNTLVQTVEKTVELGDDWHECTYAIPTPWNPVPLSEALRPVLEASTAAFKAIVAERRG